jgi:hypothetical protein
MFNRQIASALALGLFGSCLFAQGLQTKATKDDWEEINFEFNSAILSDGYPTLLRLAELLQQHRDYKIKVEGNTDYVGSVPYNEKLALARANEVKAFLTKYGAGAGQISVSGQGKRNPEVPNTTKEGRFINRRVVLTVTDANGNIIAAGSGPQVVNALDERLKKLEDCCNAILKKLDKLDDILAAIRDLKNENDRLKADVAMLKQRPDRPFPEITKPLTADQTREIAKEAATEAQNEAEAKRKKFALLGVNAGPTTYGGLNFNGSARFFAPFKETHAFQAQGEYSYYGTDSSTVNQQQGRQEGQFDIGLVNRFDNLQVGLFSSFKYLNLSQYQSGGTLGQAALTVDYVFKRGRVGAFGTKGFKNTAVVNNFQLGPSSYLQTYAQIVDQVGASALLGLWGDAYAEGNIGYLRVHGGNASNGLGTGKPGGTIRLVQPVSKLVAVTIEAGLNESLIQANNSGQVVFGLQFGNWMRPKEYGDTKSPVPVDVPRVRYQLLTRQVGHSAPVANAGPDQIGIPAGTVTLNGSASYSPDGDPLTYQWVQVNGPTVSISNSTAAIATFTATGGQSYGFRLTVKSPFGLQSSANTTVTTLQNPVITIQEFSAVPSSIALGATSQLLWNVRGASTVTISPNVGTVLPQGARNVSPTATTTYTLTASNTNGAATQTATVTVTVGAAPASNARILRFQAVPTNIMSGESSTLSWATQGAQTVTISGVTGNLPLNGSTVVSPTQTTTYTITATGADGKSSTAQAIVTVTTGGAPRVISFSANPTNISAGQSSQLCWNVEGATSISIAPGVGNVQAQACIAVSPTATQQYVLTARNAQGTTTAIATVTLGTTVQILTFTSSPDFSTSAGNPVVLSWTTTGATSVQMSGNGVPASGLPVNGSITVVPITNTDYTLSAYGPGGTSVSATIHVFVR